MKLSFRKANDQKSFDSILLFLKQDVFKHGGSASEIVQMHGKLRKLVVSSSPWGPIVINEEISILEAMIWLWQDID